MDWYSSLVLQVPENLLPYTPYLVKLIGSIKTFSLLKTQWSIPLMEFPNLRFIQKLIIPSPRDSEPLSARTRILSWWEKSETKTQQSLPSKLRSLVTLCYLHFILITLSALSQD